MTEPDPETSVGQVVAGRYELVEPIARGGMGTVWAALDQKLGRQVALKVMRKRSLDAFPDARERFEREARAAAALRSSHVVQVHDYGVDDGIPFIAMELLDGESLADRLEREGAMGVREAGHLIAQVAKGLKAAHNAGLIHRDLKPSNVFMTLRDDSEVVKLLDFGVVKSALARESEETASGVLLGTPQYMSPEQARGLRQVDHRADLWSLAVILYTILVGENPFDSEATAVGDIVIRVCIDPIPPPSEMNSDLPASIDRFFVRALERDPDARFQTADELMMAFMMAADLSFAGLDERPDFPSGSGLSAAELGIDPRGSSPGRVLIEDTPTSETPGFMATTVDEADAGSGRRALVAAGLVAALGAGLGFGAHALWRGSDTARDLPTGAASVPQTTPVVSAPATSASAAASATVTAATSASASASATTAPAKPPQRPWQPGKTGTSSGGDDGDKPPTWFPGKGGSR